MSGAEPEEMTPVVEPDTPQERAALVAWHLAHGEGITTRHAATLTNTTRRNADMLLKRLARVLPIYRDGAGIWQTCTLQEAE